MHAAPCRQVDTPCGGAHYSWKVQSHNLLRGFAAIQLASGELPPTPAAAREAAPTTRLLGLVLELAEVAGGSALGDTLQQYPTPEVGGALEGGAAHCLGRPQHCLQGTASSQGCSRVLIKSVWRNAQPCAHMEPWHEGGAGGAGDLSLLNARPSCRSARRSCGASCGAQRRVSTPALVYS